MNWPANDDELLLLHNPRCSKSRALKSALEERGASFREHLYLDEPLDADALAELRRRLDLDVARMIRPKEAEYAAAGLTADWPFSISAMQRIHVDYCGPFLLNYYALIIIDSFLRYLEIFIMKCTDAQETKIALRRFFSQFGISQLLVSDNGPQFIAKDFKEFIELSNRNQLTLEPIKGFKTAYRD